MTQVDSYLLPWKKDPPGYQLTEYGRHQIFIAYSEASHPPQTEYRHHMPSPEILAWLEVRDLDYWGMGFPVFDQPYRSRGFRGTAFVFNDKDTAMLFRLTWAGA